MKSTKINLRLFRILLNVNVIAGLIAFLSFTVLCIILNLTREVFIPLIIAWFIVQILRPVNDLTNKMKIHPYLNLAMILMVLVGLGFLGVRFLANLAVDINNVYNRYSSELMQRYNDFMALFNITPDMLASIEWGNLGLDFLRNNAGRITGFIVDISNKFFMTIFFLMFMLIEAPYTERKISKAFSGKTGNNVKEIFSKISDQISYYMLNQSLISAATALCVWGVLALMKIELAGGWAILAFFLNFIPNVGSIIATILPVIMAFVQFSTALEPLVVLVLLTIIQMVIGNIIGPKILSDSLGVSSVVIVLSLLFWSMIWGIPGAFLSVPIASILKIVCENITPLNPIAVIMSNGSAIPTEE